MSQEKVDRYKEEKKNRDKIKKKNKVKKILGIFLVALVIGALIGFPLGRWYYNYRQEHQDKEEIFMAANTYEDWFNKYWVDNYADLYTGSELASESASEGAPEGTSDIPEGTTGTGDPIKEATEEQATAEKTTEAATTAPADAVSGDQAQ